MQNYLTAWMVSTALFVVCAAVRAQPAAAPTAPAAPAQTTTPNTSGAQPASPAPATEATQDAAATSAPAAQAEGAATDGAGGASAPASPEAAPAAAAPTGSPAPDNTATAAPAAANASEPATRSEFVPPAPWPAPAEFPFAVYLVIEPQWNTDAGYDLFDDDDVGTEVGLGASYDAVELLPDVALVAELAWGMTSQDEGQLFGGAFTATDLELHRFSAAVGAHYRVLPWVGPHARIAGGLSLLSASFDGSLNDEQFEDSRVSPFLRLGAGVSGEHSLGTHIAAGVLFEGGYTLAKGVALKLEPRGDNDGIATDYAHLGKLSLSGAYLRIAALLRF
ncbi:MAG: hypothetical protein JW940_10670 [Polyangiaceae bacterium]|nr:hypothetical protein [Polyangiaceae bacterium]